MDTEKNGFGKYSSRIKRVNIPIPSFEYVHKSLFSDRLGNAETEFMIGRDNIIEKLKTWLTKEKTNGGSYLITGYRGMGKTCFVDRVIYELVGEPNFWSNIVGIILFLTIGFCTYRLLTDTTKNTTLLYGVLLVSVIILGVICKYFFLKENYKKCKYRIDASIKYIHRDKKVNNLWSILKTIKMIWTGLTAKEWDRINHLIYGANVKEKRYSHICVNINLGQEILDERNILCVLTSQLYDNYLTYVLSPIANVGMWAFYTLTMAITVGLSNKYIEGLDFKSLIPFTTPIILLFCFFIVIWHQLYILMSLYILRKRIDAEMKQDESMKIKYRSNIDIGSRLEFSYPIANTREIESQLISILNKIDKFPIHPTFYFVFDELDKIEASAQRKNDTLLEFSNERYLSTGGTSRKRKFMVMHLLANMKYFTTTAKAKFIFIAGREMYDGYLADLTDRESAISSLFNGVIYVESFCKNEKSEKDVMYNTETFISRQLIPREFIENKVMDKFIECKLKGIPYNNIDINLKLYYEYLILVYSDNIFSSNLPEEKRIKLFNAARACIDKTIGLLYHFTVYLYHVSNGSPKKMRLTFENRVRPLRNSMEFRLTKKRIKTSPLEGLDIDIYIPMKCKYLLALGEKEQRVIGFIHYISFPVNQIITDANQFGDKLLVSASFLINHLYKYHSGGFSWRNIEQTPELLEVYKIPEFRGFINSILTLLMQTHIIQIPCGLYQFKFRKQISEEISLASKVSEEISAIFNFTLDESQTVKNHYIDMLQRYQQTQEKESVKSPHSLAGIHHILADLYMADEEYNQAIFEYQTALKILEQTNKDNENPHQATFILAYIRNMLKLGTAFERRKTYTSAYNTYNEIIDLLIRFREFDEQKFGLKSVMAPTNKWPYSDAILYMDNNLNITTYKKEKKRRLTPTIKDKDELPFGLIYKTKGNRMISDFSYQMTPEKHTVIQRLAMLEDTQLVYQALLAKLFINEKIEMGGITRTNLDVIEGEFQYLHLTVNEKEKFFISTDFFRRLGDIMFYKNGLVGFSYKRQKENHNNDFCESFVDSLYYWSFNIKYELKDYCNKKHCNDQYSKMLNECRELSVSDFKEGKYININDFWNNKRISKRIKELPLDEIVKCNDRRKEMWKKNRTLPCYACKYYNRSIRILIYNLFGLDANTENVKATNILRQIIIGGSAKSMRQNHMIQLGEVLDCLGNTTLSCSSITYDNISDTFLARFLHDIHIMNDKVDVTKNTSDFLLLKEPQDFNKIETCILYFWEASICFRYGRDLKKSSGSMKKILRVIQNYLRIVEFSDNEEQIKRKTCIGEFLNAIKNRLIKQCLICLYSHYNYINTVEIQRLKWIFYTQMYENISLNRLTLFPDVEEIMQIYYEMIRLCIVDNSSIHIANEEMQRARKQILTYSRNHTMPVNFTWNDIAQRNMDFNTRLIGIYNNISMSTLRHENTVYERILSLRMKTMLNRHIMSIAFPKLEKGIWSSFSKKTNYGLILTKYFTCKGDFNANEDWKRFFPDGNFNNNPNNIEGIISDRLNLFEFLIRDSIYCLTEILETITPYTTTTLFTHSFVGSIYHTLNKWNILFDVLYWFYKFFDDRSLLPDVGKNINYTREQIFNRYDMLTQRQCPNPCSHQNVCYREHNSHKKIMAWESKCPYYDITGCGIKRNKYDENQRNLNICLDENEIHVMSGLYRKMWNCINISARFFDSILVAIDKPNIQYTLTNYSSEMALKSYRSAKEVHREGRSYKEMISRMYYLDDDLKNDTIQFDLAIERFKYNSDYIDKNIADVLSTVTDSIYDIENFCTDNETRSTLHRRFPDLFWNAEKA